MAATSVFPSALAEISFGTDYILTKELARVVRRETQTIRKSFSQKGEFLGIVPVKLGNRLMWPVREVAALFARGAK